MELITYYLLFDTEFARISWNDLVVYRSFSLMIRFGMLLKFYDHFYFIFFNITLACNKIHLKVKTDVIIKQNILEDKIKYRVIKIFI